MAPFLFRFLIPWPPWARAAAGSAVRGRGRTPSRSLAERSMLRRIGSAGLTSPIGQRDPISTPVLEPASGARRNCRNGYLRNDAAPLNSPGHAARSIRRTALPQTSASSSRRWDSSRQPFPLPIHAGLHRCLHHLQSACSYGPDQSRLLSAEHQQTRLAAANHN